MTGTKVSYSYDQATSTVTSTYAFTTTARQGTATGTVTALYPHQWNSLVGAAPIAPTYVSARGTMKVLTEVSQFTIVWKEENGQWRMSRALSYDHQLAE